MADYIPGTDADKVLWLSNFTSWLTAHGAAHGFTPPDITAMATALNAASFALGNHETQQAIARSTTAAKNTDNKKSSTPRRKAAKSSYAHGSRRLCAFAPLRLSPVGCEVQTARGGIPAAESQWVTIEVDTESPVIHVVADTTPTTYAYRARYVGKNLKFGPFGDPAICTVSV